MFDRIYLEITNVCNFNCSFCPGCKREQQFMSVENFFFLAKELRAYTDCLCLHVMGEPLLHPELDEILTITDALKYRVIITTNGSLLEKRGELLIAHPSVYKINISLHSFEANNIGSENYLPGCVDFARRSSGKGKITVLRLWNLDGILKGESSRNEEIYRYIRTHIDGFWKENSRGFCIDKKLYLEYDERFVWPSPDGEILQENGYCRALSSQLAILCDGRVVPCCLDGQGEMVLGNALKESLKEILSSERVRAFGEGLQKGRFLHPLCKTCGYALRFRKRQQRTEQQH